MADKRKIYSREYKEQAVELLNTSDKPGNQIEAELGIGNDRDKEVAELPPSTTRASAGHRA